MFEEVKDWITAAVEREATPKALRTDTVEDFTKKWGVPPSTYYYQVSKKENQERILEIALNSAKKHAPEVLENLGERAKKDNKAAELYLDYILKLAKNLDIKSDVKPIPILYVPKDNSNKQDNGDEETSKRDTRGDISEQDNLNPTVLDSLSAE